MLKFSLGKDVRYVRCIKIYDNPYRECISWHKALSPKEAQALKSQLAQKIFKWNVESSSSRTLGRWSCRAEIYTLEEMFDLPAPYMCGMPAVLSKELFTLLPMLAEVRSEQVA
ncbi:hypothetical protein [Neptuniibacter sp. QD37_11]|uniref:hypothetical protein n=1 Tax=Neptuniibacter sp. QD37_11 TaxID=3398209 RepID=UPI0039F51D22